MNLETIRERVKEFRPFTLITSSGNKYPVPHQDFIFSLFGPSLLQLDTVMP